MVRRHSIAAMTVLAVACFAWAGEPSLEGEWQVVRGVSAGKAVPDLEICVFAFTKDTLKVIPVGAMLTREIDPISYSLDLKKSPKQIQLVPLDGPDKGKKTIGIYKFDDGQLTICMPDAPDRPAPTEFASPEGSKNVLIALKRKN